jgi:plasmid maintenance system antidote protein VapI
MDRQHMNPGDVLAEEFMKPFGLSARAWAQPSEFREMTERSR